jgi:hypothetical protein
MTGAASWMTVSLLLLGAIGVGLLLVFSARINWRFPWSRLDVKCPASGKSLEVTAVYDLETARWVNVARCKEPGFPACGRECLHPQLRT